MFWSHNEYVMYTVTMFVFQELENESSNYFSNTFNFSFRKLRPTSVQTALVILEEMLQSPFLGQSLFSSQYYISYRNQSFNFYCKSNN